MLSLKRSMSSSCLLPDIREIHIDTTLPPESRLRVFADTIGDPYHFRVGETEVELLFNNDGPSLYACLVKLNGRCQ